MAEDLWKLLQDSLNSLKAEIKDIGDKFNDAHKNIWIKLTELEVRLDSEIKKDKNVRDDLKWLVPIIVSVIAILITYFRK